MQTTTNILQSLIDQHYIPATQVFRDPAHGSVDVVIYNIHGDHGQHHAGEPFVRFIAIPTRGENRLCQTLTEALAHIGIYG